MTGLLEIDLFHHFAMVFILVKHSKEQQGKLHYETGTYQQVNLILANYVFTAVEYFPTLLIFVLLFLT